jgi:hypothetical protein
MAPETRTLLETVAGAALILFGLVDVFLTVLYARIGYSLIGAWVSRGTRNCFRWLAQPFGAERGRILSFCGPVIVVLLIATWSATLVVGTALILHPQLGRGVAPRTGGTSTDFTTALYASSGSLSIANSTDFEPKTPAIRLLYVANSLIGTSVVSLVLMYLMQVYTALQERNALALKIHLASRSTGDAAEFVAALCPRGSVSAGVSSLAEIAGELARMKEAHHFYPVVVYFRFREPLYAVSRFSFVVLDADALLRTAVAAEPVGRFADTAPVLQLGQGARLLVETLDTHFAGGATASRPDAATRDAWRRRFAAAIERLQGAGVPLVADLAAAAERYVILRAEWQHHIDAIAPLMGYTSADVDVVGDRLGAPARR